MSTRRVQTKENEKEKSPTPPAYLGRVMDDAPRQGTSSGSLPSSCGQIFLYEYLVIFSFFFLYFPLSFHSISFFFLLNLVAVVGLWDYQNGPARMADVYLRWGIIMQRTF